MNPLSSNPSSLFAEPPSASSPPDTPYLPSTTFNSPPSTPATSVSPIPSTPELSPTMLPTYPIPLRRPIFICRHTTGPLPINYSSLLSQSPNSHSHSHSRSPPPLVFLHPCRACHFAFTENLVGDIFSRFEQDLNATDARLERVAKLLEPGYKPDVARVREMLLKSKARAMEMRRGEIKEAWDSFRAVWGTWGFGRKVDRKVEVGVAMLGMRQPRPKLNLRPKEVEVVLEQMEMHVDGEDF